MQKKKLDELFQEKFLDFKEAPDNKVWRAIDASLEKKRKKRIIPIWWQLGGIAAVLAIGLLLLNPFAEKQTSNEILVDTQEEVEQPNKNQTESINEYLFDSLKTNNNALTNTELEKTIKSVEKQNATAKSTIKSTKPSQTESSISKDNRSKESNALVDNDSGNDKNGNDMYSKSLSENSITNQTPEETIHNEKGIPKNKIPNNASITATKNLNDNHINSDSLDIKTAITSNETSEKKQEVDEVGKKSIFEELTEENEEIEVASNNTNRWSAGPNIAPVYFNAVGKGSPVNSIFVPNSKSGNINLSYGVSIAYAVSKKLTIRSGINKVDYGYDTEDVAFSSSLGSINNNGQLANIDYAETSNTLTISSEKVSSDKFSTVSNSIDASAKSATREGFMSQQLGYIELPVEINYALLDTKFGINLIGGVSSLFLIDNAVSLTSGDLTTEIGEANNINDLNFSANMGLGFNYKFSPKVRFNLEPIFKYQLNTFSEIDGTFRPYSIGVYSGINFKF